MRPPTEKPQSELERNFVEAYERLTRANQAYDLGHWGDAPNIAKEVFNFVFDYGKQKSILTYLSLKERISFLSSTRTVDMKDFHRKAILTSPEYRLVQATIGFDGMGYVPFLGKSICKNLDFQDWWNEPILTWLGREDISRGEIIQFIRHTEGGGHVAGSYEQRWSKMKALITGDWTDGTIQFGNGAKLKPENYALAYANIRQIGWEMINTLDSHVPDLISQANFYPTQGPRMRPAADD